METLIQDLRYGLRMLAKNPGFTAVVVLTLALGIGANTAIFSVVNTVLLRPLPYGNPNQLVVVESINGQGKQRFGGVSPADFWDWKEQSKAFEELAVYSGGGVSINDVEHPESLPAARVSVNFFQTFAVQPWLGRGFLLEEGLAGGPSAIVLSYRLWQGRFGADPAIVGKTLPVGDRATTVVGVMPPNFRFPSYAEVWTPLARDSSEMRYRANRYFSVVGRLNPGQSIEAAQTEMRAIAGRLEAQYPKDNQNWGVRLTSLRPYLVRDTRLALLVLMGAVSFVLLLAWVNVAGLLLVRAALRRKEIVIRLALGASRWRLLRQLLTESLLMALAGGAAGLLLGKWGVDALIRFLPPSQSAFVISGDIHLDGLVLWFTLLVSSLAGVFFGLVPSWLAAKMAVAEGLKEGRRGTSGRSLHRIRSVLTAAEISLALVLLIGAGLLLSSFLRLRQIDLGYNPHGLMTTNISLPSQNKPLFVRQMVEQVLLVPGVDSVAVMSGPSFGFLNFPFNIEGRPLPTGDVTVRYSAVSPNYFRVLKAALRVGREFNDRDRTNAPPVAIINETLAREFFGAGGPIGKKIEIGYLKARLVHEIVGVVGDIIQDEPGTLVKPEICVPFEQVPWLSAWLVVRSSFSNPLSLKGAVQQAIWSVDKNQLAAKAETLEQRLASQTAEPRLYTVLLGVFASVALLLAALGLYGVVSYSVTQRTNEIGVRIALGAQKGEVLMLVIRQGMKLTLVGLGIGFVGALALTRVLSSLLFRVKPTDPVTFLSVALLLTAVALVACWLPARRASKVDPMVALRYE